MKVIYIHIPHTGEAEVFSEVENSVYEAYGGLRECFDACRTKRKSCALMLGDQQEPQWTTGVPPTLSIRELQTGSEGSFVSN